MPAQGPLLGRDREIAVIGHALREAENHRSSIVVIEGEAGIGKSRLLAAACEEGRRRGMQIAVGRAEELDQGRPFGVMARALGCDATATDPRRAEIAGLLTPREPADRGPITVTSDQGLQFRVVDAMADLVEELTIAGPMLVAVDDLQWVDPSSLVTLAAIARRPAYLPTALMCCLRPVPREPDLERLLDTLLDTPRTRHVRLGGLDAAAASAMITQITASPPGPSLSAAVSRAGGNPLFIGELLRSVQDDAAITVVDGRSEVDAGALSPTLRATILRRVSYLSGRSLTLLRAAAILGSSFTLSDLSATTGQSAFDLSLALADALSAQVLEDSDDGLRFRHDMIRDAIYEDLPVSVRRGLHREAAHRLADAGAPVLQVAQQYSRAAVPGDARAIEWIIRAARGAAPRSPSVAVTLLNRALALMDGVGVERDHMCLERASCLLLSGRIIEAIEACQDLLGDDHDAAVQVPTRICLAHALIASGRAGDALAELLHATTSAASATERVSAIAWASLASFWTGDLAQALELTERTRSYAAGAEDSLSVSVALAVRACVLQLQGRLPAALEQIDDAIERAGRSPARAGHRYPLHLSRGHILMDLDQFDDAITAIGTGRRICAEFGLRWALASHHMVGGRVLFLAGEWDDALVEFEAAFELAGEGGESLNAFIGHAVIALIRLHRNDLPGAEHAAAEADRLLQRRSGMPYRGPWAVWARTLVSEAHDGPAVALDALSRCWDECIANGQRVDLPILGPDLVRLAIGAGERTRARSACAVLDVLAAGTPVPSIGGAALRCRGLVGDDAALLLDAVEAYAAGPRLLDTALVREEAAQALVRCDRMELAREQLTLAIETYERFEAARGVLRVEAALRAVGVRRGVRGTRDRPRSGWDGLTPTERTVVDLVAEGLSNPQIAEQLFVSHRTVQTHLSHVFAKLDISSRVQLAAEVARRRAAAL